MKLVKFLIVSVMLAVMAVLAGCGSDKYVGSWYAIDNMNNPPDAYIRLDIEKNGNGYLLKKNIFRYDRKVVIVNEKEYEEGKKFSSPFMTGEDYAAAMKKRVAPIWEITDQWVQVGGEPVPAILKDDKLRTDGGSSLVYIEKNDTLLVGRTEFKKEKNFKPKDVQMQFKKQKEDRIEEMKKERETTTNKASAPIIQKVEFIDEVKEKK